MLQKDERVIYPCRRDDLLNRSLVEVGVLLDDSDQLGDPPCGNGDLADELGCGGSQGHPSGHVRLELVIQRSKHRLELVRGPAALDHSWRQFPGILHTSVFEPEGYPLLGVAPLQRAHPPGRLRIGELDSTTQVTGQHLSLIGQIVVNILELPGAPADSSSRIVQFMHELGSHPAQSRHPLLVAHGVLDATEAVGHRPKHPSHDAGVAEEPFERLCRNPDQLRVHGRADRGSARCPIEHGDLAHNLSGSELGQDHRLDSSGVLGDRQLAFDYHVHLFGSGALGDDLGPVFDFQLFRRGAHIFQELVGEIREVGKAPENLLGRGHRDARCWCTNRMAVEPSPTAPATRRIEPCLTSPATKTPGTEASRGRGSRSEFQPLRGPRSVPV